MERVNFYEILDDLEEMSRERIEKFINANNVQKRGQVDDGDLILINVYYGYEYWTSRAEVSKFYLDAMGGSDGSEQNRYANLFSQLASGVSFAYDEDSEYRKLHKKFFPEKY